MARSRSSSIHAKQKREYRQRKKEASERSRSSSAHAIRKREYRQRKKDAEEQETSQFQFQRRGRRASRAQQSGSDIATDDLNARLTSLTVDSESERENTGVGEL